MNRMLSILLTSLCAFVAADSTKPMPGGSSKVSVTDKGVTAAAVFAIRAQSKTIQNPKAQQQATLELVKIIGAEQQVVAGMNYRLTLSVKENGSLKTVEAVVWWQPWRKPKAYQLTSWK
jgi:hypothetical protein